MTWTSAFGKGCGVILQYIVDGLALTRISPNVLTFLGLLINTVAAILFGLANEHNYVRMFLYAGLVIIGAGIFDMVDGRVARQTDQVTVFGAFFDSVIDRYSDVVLFFGLLVFYARGNRFFYVVLAAFVMVTSLMVSYTRARAEALIGSCKVGFMERPERVVLIILGALFNRWGVMAPGPLGAGRVVHHHRHPPHQLYLSTNQDLSRQGQQPGPERGHSCRSSTAATQQRPRSRSRPSSRAPRLMMRTGPLPGRPVLLVHGGAWDIPDDQLEAHRRGVTRAVKAGYALLKEGGSSLDAVEAAVTLLEDDETFDAGRGSFLTRDGRVQLDALLMDGATLRVGAVACVERLRNPIQAARLVLERSPHLYFVGQGAEEFAREQGITLIENEELVLDRERQRLAEAQARERAGIPDQTFAGTQPPADSHDTVGAVAHRRRR